MFCSLRCKRAWHRDEDRKTDHELLLHRPRRPCDPAVGCAYCDAVRVVANRDEN